MIKNTIIILLLSLALVSCGKKGCPMHSTNETKKCNPVFKP